MVPGCERTTLIPRMPCGGRPMSGPRWGNYWSRPLAAVGAALALVFTVAMVVFLYIGSLAGQLVNRDAVANGAGTARNPQSPAGQAGGSEPATESTGTQAAQTAGSATSSNPAPGGASSGALAARTVHAAEAQPGVLPTQTHPSQPRRYSDPAFGFQVMLPDNWQAAEVHADDATPIDAADYDVVFEEPESHARMSFSVWANPAQIPLNMWIMDAGSGMRSVRDQWPTNAFIAGAPALVMWSPETPATPARYGAFFVHDQQYWRVLYSADDGGVAAADFVRALRTLGWSDGDTGAIVPPLQWPTARYFPHARLYEP